MNWGYRLTIFFTAFVALIGTLVYKAMNSRFDLVSKDYYKDELHYQERINAMANSAQLGALNVTQDSMFVTITLPGSLKGQPAKGDLLFYCKTDATKDRVIPLAINEDGVQVISKKLLPAKQYLVKANWQSGDKSYYIEKEVALQ